MGRELIGLPVIRQDMIFICFGHALGQNLTVQILHIFDAPALIVPDPVKESVQTFWLPTESLEQVEAVLGRWQEFVIQGKNHQNQIFQCGGAEHLRRDIVAPIQPVITSAFSPGSAGLENVGALFALKHIVLAVDASASAALPGVNK